MSIDMQTTTEAPCVTGKPLAHDQYIVEQLTKLLCSRQQVDYPGDGYPARAGVDGIRDAAVREHRCAADPAAGFTGPCDGPADWRTVVTAPDREPEWSPRMCRVHADQWMAECDRLPGAYPHEIVCDPYPCDHPAGTVNGVCPSCGPIECDEASDGGEHFVISPAGARHIVASNGRCQTCGPQCAFEASQP